MRPLLIVIVQGLDSKVQDSNGWTVIVQGLDSNTWTVTVQDQDSNGWTVTVQGLDNNSSRSRQ